MRDVERNNRGLPPSCTGLTRASRVASNDFALEMAMRRRQDGPVDWVLLGAAENRSGLGSWMPGSRPGKTPPGLRQMLHAPSCTGLTRLDPCVQGCVKRSLPSPRMARSIESFWAPLRIDRARFRDARLKAGQDAPPGRRQMPHPGIPPSCTGLTRESRDASDDFALEMAMRGSQEWPGSIGSFCAPLRIDRGLGSGMPGSRPGKTPPGRRQMLHPGIPPSCTGLTRASRDASNERITRWHGWRLRLRHR